MPHVQGDKFGFKKYTCTLPEMQQLVLDIDNLNTQFVRVSLFVHDVGRELEKRRPLSPTE